MNRFILAVLACILVACSGDSTAPKGPGVSGRWIYRIDGLSDGKHVNCSMTTEDTLTLARSESRVAGRYQGGAISCAGWDVESLTIVTGAVVNGTVDAMVNGTQAVSFDLGSASWHQSGGLTGDRMTGTVTIDHTFRKLGTVHLTGAWSARRTTVIPPRPQPK